MGKEYTLNYDRIPNMIYKVYFLIKGSWRLRAVDCNMLMVPASHPCPTI